MTASPGIYVGYSISVSTSYLPTATKSSAGKAEAITKGYAGTILKGVPKVTFIPQGQIIMRPAIVLVYRDSDVPHNPPNEMVAQRAPPMKSYALKKFERVLDEDESIWKMVLGIWAGGLLLGMMVMFLIHWIGVHGFPRRKTRKSEHSPPSSLPFPPSKSSASSYPLTPLAAKHSVTAATSTNGKEQHESSGFSSWVIPWYMIALAAWVVLALAVLVLLFATKPELEDAIIAYTGSADSVLRVLQAVGLVMRMTMSLLSWTVVADLAWIGMTSGISMKEIASLLDVVTMKGYG